MCLLVLYLTLTYVVHILESIIILSTSYRTWLHSRRPASCTAPPAPPWYPGCFSARICAFLRAIPSLALCCEEWDFWHVNGWVGTPSEKTATKLMGVPAVSTVASSSLASTGLEVLLAVGIRVLAIHLYAMYYRTFVPKTACGITFLGVLPALIIILVGSLLSVYGDDLILEITGLANGRAQYGGDAVLEVLRVENQIPLDAFARQQ